MPTVAAISEYLECFAPSRLAADWDNVGLLLGDAATEVRQLLTCLTVTPEVVAEAVSGNVQMIVSHHPILFRGIKKLTSQDAEGRLLLPLIQAGIAVYSPHTAFDNCAGGINDMLAERIGLTSIRPLRGRSQQSYKIVVFVPETDLAKVSQAMFDAGAGVIGQYSQCSYRTYGTGTFFGSQLSNPSIGSKGQREEVSEWRLEVVCPEACLDKAIQALRRSHSYEEPAFDVYPLKVESARGHEGRVGRLEAPICLGQLAGQVKEKLAAAAVQIVGDSDRSIETIAVACGAAGEFLSDAIKAKADAFLTGEMRFHDYLKAKEEGIALILPGHYATERPAVEQLADKLELEWPDLKVWASKEEHDPVTWT